MHLRSKLTAALGSLSLLVLASPALAQDDTETPAVESPQEQFKLEFGSVLWLVIIVALLWLIPIVLDIWKAYSSRKNHTTPVIERLISKAAIDNLTLEEIREFTGVLGRTPSGMEGLARALMALTVGMILFISLVVLVFTGVEQDLVETILTALTTGFTTIVAFYFGARTAQTSHESASTPPTSGPQTVSPEDKPPSAAGNKTERTTTGAWGTPPSGAKAAD